MDDNNLTKEELSKLKAKDRKRKNRAKPEIKLKEYERNRAAKIKFRNNNEWRKEQKMDTKAHRLARRDKKRRNIEQQRNTEAHRLARSDLKRRQQERENDKIAQKLARCELKESITFNVLCESYEKNIKKGPTDICNSCFGLFFETSIRTVFIQTLINNGLNRDFLETIVDMTQDKVNLCISCHRDVIKIKAPTLSKVNGLSFPVIPTELQNMTEVELRLVSPRIPFMQIRELSKRDKQFAIKGNVVNVPVSVDTSVSVLPRTFDNSFTVQLKLKRKLCY
jgi:Fe2+ transport system protein B